MKAVIPVAGVGSRLRPHTFTTPKALVPVAGKPILGHILDELVDLGVRDVILIIGRHGERIQQYVDTRYSFRVRYVVQRETLGIAHAIHQCREALDDEPVLIVLGDTVYHTDFSLLRTVSDTSAIGVKALEGDLRRYGLVEAHDGRVTRLVEKPDKPRSNLVIAGIYYIAHPGLLKRCLEQLIRSGRTTHGEYQLTDALQLMVERGEPLTTFPVEEWYDCGTPDALLATNRRLLELQGTSCTIEGSVVIPPVAIADDARIEASVVGPFVSVSNGASVIHTVVTNSIIGEDAIVRCCCLDASVIGPGASVTGHAHRLNTGAQSSIYV